MSQPTTSEQKPTMSDKKPNRQLQPTRAPVQPTQHQQTRGPTFPPIPSEIRPDQFRKLFNQMMNLHEQYEAEEAEKLAHLLLSHAALPVMYRAFAQMVLVQGERERLVQAREAVADVKVQAGGCEPEDDQEGDEKDDEKEGDEEIIVNGARYTVVRLG